ncbi:FAD/NAD(P)-binding domain-containing protein [Xylariaceae sp. FL1019]|nr:FAD/NAD(P)-binding domain-containing protein [Xylariaceae sp. FL1019]
MALNLGKPRVLIAGAGIGGLTLAQCLRKQGIPFQIFDRDHNLDDRQGWAIGVHSILNDIATSFSDDMPSIKSADHLTPLKLEAQIALYYRNERRAVQNSPETPCMRLNRLKLRGWLATHIDVQWSKRVSRVDENETGVALHFEDGTSASGDVLVGADGLNSVVREHLLGRPNQEVLHVNKLASIWGETTIAGEVLERQLSLGHSAYVSTSKDYAYWFFVGLKGVNEDFSADYYWYIAWPDETVGQPDHWMQTATKADKYERMHGIIEKFDPKFREVFELTPVDRILPGVWVSRDGEVPPFPVKNAVLLGDAAHPMTPFRGEGGMHAIRDALNLSRALGQWTAEEPAKNRHLLESYQTESLERGGQAVMLSRNAWKNNAIKGAKLISWGHEAKLAAEEVVRLDDVRPEAPAVTA